MKNKNIISIQNSLSEIGGGAIAQKSILDSYSQEGTITNIEIFKFIKPSKLNKYLFNPKLFFEIRKLIIETKPNQIIIGQFHSILTIILILLTTKKISKILIVHTAENVCLNSLLTKKDKSQCIGGIGSKCVTNKCVKKRNGFVRIIFSKWYNFILKRNIACYFVLSDFMKIKLENNGFKNIKKISVKTDVTKIITKRKIRKPIINFLYVGVLEWNKGVKEMILGFKYYASINSDNNYFLEIVGSGSMREELEFLVKQENLESRIKFSGSVPNNQINNYYAKSDVFIFCSFFETYGLVIQEAIKNNMFIICHNRGALKELLNNYKSKVMLEDVEAETISKAILNYIKYGK